MRAAILAIGTELLGTDRLDTNSLRLTAVLEARGVELLGKAVAGDREEEIADQLRYWAARVDLLLVTGGLGPTADDRTRAAAARALGRGLTIDEELVAALRRRLEAYGRRMAEVNRRQAEVIEGGRLLENPVGTAPGWQLEAGGTHVFLFPGVPRELEAMMESSLLPWLDSLAGGEAADRASGVERRTFKVASVPESEVEESLGPLYEAFGRDAISVLASPGEVRIVLAAGGEAPRRRDRLAAMAETLRDCLGEAIFAEGAEATLEAEVGRLLAAAGRTVVTAESCTGGLLAERLTRVAGSSAWFLGGVVSYSNALKRSLLGVEAAELEAHGAVSRPVALAMARGARQRYGVDYGVGITGVAGPGGGSEAKPVGTVHLALAGPGDGDLDHRPRRFPGDRELVRAQSAQLALEMLRRNLLRSSTRG